MRTSARFLSLLLLAASLFGGGCGRVDSGDRNEKALAVETDAFGRRVFVHEYPRRIVSMAPSNTEMLLSLGLQERLVGVTSFYDSPEKVEGIASIGGYINPSVERIISLRPDLVFAARGNPKAVIEQLRRRGINVFTLDTKTLSGLLADIRTVGALTGTKEEAKHVVGEMAKTMADIRQKVSGKSRREQPKVFWIGQEQPLRTAGPGSIVDELISLAGGVNVAADERTPWPSYGMEKLVLRNPEVIILSEDKYKSSPGEVAATVDRFRKHAVWGNLSAVKRGRVHFIAADVLGQPSPACIEGLKLLARYLHPGLFPQHGEEGIGEDREDGGD